jgi:hypothetical protein
MAEQVAVTTVTPMRAVLRALASLVRPDTGRIPREAPRKRPRDVSNRLIVGVSTPIRRISHL